MPNLRVGMPPLQEESRKKGINPMNETIFKAYDIRGIYPEAINEEASWKIGHATAQFLRSLLGGYDRGQANAQSLIVGRDNQNDAPIDRRFAGPFRNRYGEGEGRIRTGRIVVARRRAAR